MNSTCRPFTPSPVPLSSGRVKPSLSATHSQDQADKDHPRIVTQQQIKRFELLNPSLAGIGQIMVDLGIWVVLTPMEAV